MGSESEYDGADLVLSYVAGQHLCFLTSPIKTALVCILNYVDDSYFLPTSRNTYEAVCGIWHCTNSTNKYNMLSFENLHLAMGWVANLRANI